MNREYIAFFIVNGREMSRSKPMRYGLAIAWCMEKKKTYHSYICDKSWQLYLEIPSQMIKKAKI